MLTESPEQNELHPQGEGALLLGDGPAGSQRLGSARYSGSVLGGLDPHGPERDDDGGGLGARRDQRDDEEEDQEGDEGAAGAVALPRHGVAVLVQVRLDDDQLQLVAALPAGGRRDDLPALDAGAVRVVPDLRSDPESSVKSGIIHIPERPRGAGQGAGQGGGGASPRCCRWPRCCSPPGRG